MRRFNSIAAVQTPISTYNGISTLGAGVPYIVAKSNLTAQGAAISATTLYAVPSGATGMYRVCWCASVTQAATTSCVLGGVNGFQVIYTNLNDSVVKTSNPTNITLSAINATGTTISGDWFGYCKGGTNLQYSFGWTNVGITPMQYDLNIMVEALL